METNAAWKNAFVGAGYLAGGYVAYRVMTARLRHYDFRGRVVVVTGGSRGLGLLLSRRLAAEGARLAICARNEQELNRAAQQLRECGADVLSFQCDLTDEQQLEDFFATVRYEMGPVDVLVNNAGVMQVGPVETQTEKDVDEAMAIHFWAPLRAIEHVATDMIRRGNGRIVNISSIGGKIAVPHMLPYCASKFALSGMSQGLRIELAKYGVFVTTVCPGLMRTGSPRHAWFKGRHRDEYTWFSVGGSLPGLSMNADVAAKRIIYDCRYGQAMLTLSLPAKLASTMNVLAPGITAEAASIVAQLLPPPGGVGTTSVEGSASASDWSPSLLTLLNERAAVANNEILPQELAAPGAD
jgi:NAD(P)-dependent dehydrogenase (short-subunit alcohol dehydrogenase family)